MIQFVIWIKLAYSESDLFPLWIQTGRIWFIFNLNRLNQYLPKLKWDNLKYFVRSVCREAKFIFYLFRSGKFLFRLTKKQANNKIGRKRWTSCQFLSTSLPELKLDKKKSKMLKLGAIFILVPVCLSYYVPLSIDFMGNKEHVLTYDLDRKVLQVCYKFGSKLRILLFFSSNLFSSHLYPSVMGASPFSETILIWALGYLQLTLFLCGFL